MQVKMYVPDAWQIKAAIECGEKIRGMLIDICAFDAAAAMRDLLALAYNQQQKNREQSE